MHTSRLHYAPCTMVSLLFSRRNSKLQKTHTNSVHRCGCIDLAILLRHAVRMTCQREK